MQPSAGKKWLVGERQRPTAMPKRKREVDNGGATPVSFRVLLHWIPVRISSYNDTDILKTRMMSRRTGFQSMQEAWFFFAMRSAGAAREHLGTV